VRAAEPPCRHWHWDIRRAVVVGVDSIIGAKSPTRGLVAPRPEGPDQLVNQPGACGILESL